MAPIANLSIGVTVIQLALPLITDYAFIANSIITLLFSFALIFFTTVFLENWKREEGKWKHIWGLQDVKDD